MMANIIPFDFETNAVRIVMIDGDPVFVAADVCRALEISQYRDAIARLDDDERVSVLVDTLGGNQTMTAVTESGLYALIMTSRKPAAKRFRKWVTAEVLPAIRRDGAYALPDVERQALDEKRAYFEGLSEAQKEKARGKAEAMRRYDELVDAGWKRTEAARAVAEEYQCSERTIWNMRHATYMVPEADHAVALGRKGTGTNPALYADCHPEFLRLFMEMVLSGQKIASCYRRALEIAQENGWEPIPSARTMHRRAANLLPRSANRKTLH